MAESNRLADPSAARRRTPQRLYHQPPEQSNAAAHIHGNDESTVGNIGQYIGTNSQCLMDQYQPTALTVSGDVWCRSALRRSACKPQLELFSGHKRQPAGIVSPQIGVGTCESEVQSGHPPNSAVMAWWPTVGLSICTNRCKQTEISCCRCACTARVPTSISY